MVILSKESAELMGMMFGDGCLSRSGNKHFVYLCGHKIDDFEYHSNVTKRLFKELFDKDIKIHFRTRENTLYIKFSDAAIFNQIKSFGMPVGKKYANLKMPRWLHEDLFLFAFLRGLFDTDGCVVLSKQHKKIKYYPRLEIASKSKTFLLDILKKLREKGFYGSVSVKGDCYRLELPGFNNLSLWMTCIGMKNSKHIRKITPKLL